MLVDNLQLGDIPFFIKLPPPPKFRFHLFFIPGLVFTGMAQKMVFSGSIFPFCLLVNILLLY